MKVTETQKWISPLKDLCIKVDNINKETYEKLIGEIAAVIGYQYKLSNFMNAYYATLSNKTRPNYQSHLNVSKFDQSTMTDSSKAIYDVANNFIDLILDSLTTYRHQQLAQELADIHNIFYDKIIKRNAYLAEHPSIIPPYRKTLDLNFHLDSQATSGHNTEFSSYLANLIQISYDSDFDKKYIPNAETVSYLYQNLDDSPILPQLLKILEDLDKTRLELSKEQTSLEQKVKTTDEFLLNLPKEAIRENRQFSDFIRSTHRILPQIRSNNEELMSSLYRTPEVLHNLYVLFQESVPTYNIDAQEMEELRAKFVKLNLELKKLNLFKRIVQDSGVNPYSPNQAQLFISQEKDFLKNMKKLISEEKHQEISLLIDNGLSSFEHYAESIPAENEEIQKNTRDADSQMQKWANSRALPDPQLSYEVRNMQDKINALKEQSDEIIVLSSNSLNQAIISMTELNQHLQFNPPLDEQTINNYMTVSENAAQEKWLKARFEKKQDSVEEKKRRLEYKKKELERQQSKLAALQRELDGFRQKKLENPNAGGGVTPDEFQDAKERAKCSSCGLDNERSAILKECGHTFCMNCIKQRLKSRMRTCPSCEAKFQESSICEIIW